jgi:hypothetical protein
MPTSSYRYEDFRPLKRGEAGYSRTRRQYVSPSTGEILPVSRFQQLARGGTSYREYREERLKAGISPKTYHSGKTYRNQLFTEYYDAQVKIAIQNNLPVPTPQELQNSIEWHLIPNWLKTKDNSPTGKKAQALIWLGRRQPGWYWDVSDTPD